MGKHKAKLRAQHKSTSNNQSKIHRRHHSQQLTPKKNKASKSNNLSDSQNPNTGRRPQIPFSSHDKVLLVGEGDFSFALSLAKHHKPARLTATCYDNEEELKRKYPSVEETIQALLESVSVDGDDGTSEDSVPASDDFPNEDETNSLDLTSDDIKGVTKTDVIFGVDATKLSTSHRKRLRPGGPFTKIVFNFPHVGGLSTDVNRQVRANQQLLVGFFNSANSLLAKNGQILVTVFEGEPYTLWNVRDLGRHSDLQVVESFKFPWQAYPGYKHARTLGDITSGKDRAEEGKRKGAWRGEERDARCYIFQPKEHMQTPAKLKKRKRTEDTDDESD
jgi:25S rRNA (uracil2634-N3)-methyltransferase